MTETILSQNDSPPGPDQDRAREGVLIARLRIEMNRGVSNRDTELVRAAVLVGNSELRPMTLIAIARWIEMAPRTVKRHLEALIAAGSVVRQGSRYFAAAETEAVNSGGIKSAARLLIERTAA